LVTCLLCHVSCILRPSFALPQWCGREMLRTIFSFTLAPLTVATPAELLQIQTGGFDAFLHCRHSKEYRAFYNVLHANGWHSDETFKFAYNMHNELDLGQGHDELQDLPWHTTLKVSPGAATWMLRQVMLLANFFGVEASANISLSEMMEGRGQSGDLQEMDCPYGFIALEYAVLIGFQQFGYGQLRDEVASALTASIEILLHAPYYTYDFFASTTWNVSLYDMAVNLDSERNYKSYAEYKEIRPIPGPHLEPWHSTALRPSGAAMPSTLPPLRISMLQFHDGSALELLSSTKAALRSLSGLQNPEPVVDEVRLYFTQVKALRNTDGGKWLAQHVVADFSTLKAMFQDLQEGKMSMEEVGKEWLPREAKGLEDADIIICSEPMWLCPFLRPRRSSVMLGVLHMALLNEFPSTRPADLWSFWSGFKSMLEERRLLPSAACRITIEQVAHQSGWQLPYVPFIGLGIDARYAPAPDRRALVFRNNRQNTLAFRSALRMFVDSMPNFPVKVLDMNDINRALSFQEIAEFHCVILLPHGPNALRLSDVYAASIPVVVPEEPLVQNFIWSSRTFGGYDAEPRYLDLAPEALRSEGNRSPVDFHPTNYLQSWSIHRFIDDRRYWYQYTEWATLPHLLRFGSVPALLSLLEELTAQRGFEVSAKMARHHVSMVADALTWWRLALADALA